MHFKLSIQSIKQSYEPGESIELRWVLQNESNQKIYFINWGLPLDKHLMEDNFEVKRENGDRLPHRGKRVLRRPIQCSDYTQIGPNQSIEMEVDINPIYQVYEPDNYLVQSICTILDYKLDLDDKANLGVTQK